MSRRLTARRPLAVPRGVSVLRTVTVLAALTCLLTAGCATAGTSAGTPDTSGGARNLSVAELTALVEKDRQVGPYSATVDVEVRVATLVGMSMTGQINLNTPMTGHFFLRIGYGGAKAQTAEMILTTSAGYTRISAGEKDPTGPWRKIAKSQLGDTLSFASFAGYAGVLLKKGVHPVRGVEDHGGVTANRLSGHLSADEIQAIDPRVYSALRAEKLDGFDCDIWVDDAGRTVRMDQWMKTQGQQMQTTLILSGFGTPITITAPAQ